MNTQHANTRLATYVKGGKDKVDGWFGRIDAELFRALLNAQAGKKLSGSVAEIGVHHGKAFIALCLSLQEDEKAYCVDVFDDQHLNKDRSGKGNRDIFERNLRKWGIDFTRLRIHKNSSLDTHASDILDEVGPVRFFSIDGGHWGSIVRNDLKLAEACVAEHGIIALDDFFRAEWPDVSAAYFDWFRNKARPLVPFAIGFNKLYLCNETWKVFYQDIIAQDAFLHAFITKNMTFQDVDVPVLNEFIQPEMTIFRRRSAYLRIIRPDAFSRSKKIYKMADKASKILRRRDQ